MIIMLITVLWGATCQRHGGRDEYSRRPEVRGRIEGVRRARVVEGVEAEGVEGIVVDGVEGIKVPQGPGVLRDGDVEAGVVQGLDVGGRGGVEGLCYRQ